jgi:hypothetical protein
LSSTQATFDELKRRETANGGKTILDQNCSRACLNNNLIGGVVRRHGSL